jgi:hypothetical protein
MELGNRVTNICTSETRKHTALQQKKNPLTRNNFVERNEHSHRISPLEKNRNNHEERAVRVHAEFKYKRTILCGLVLAWKTTFSYWWPHKLDNHDRQLL